MLQQLRLALLLSFVLCIFNSDAQSQDSSGLYEKAYNLPDRLFGVINKKSQHLQNKLEASTVKYLRKLERSERKLQRQLAKKDSAAAEEIFGSATSTYKNFEQRFTDSSRLSSLQDLYSSRIDSMKSVFDFLQANKLLSQSSEAQNRIARAMKDYNQLQQKLNQTEDIRQAIIERQQYITQRLQPFTIGKRLRKYQEQVYYYREQVDAYKRMLEDPQKLEAKLLQVVRRIPAFQNFFRRNSQLGNLFQLPGSEDLAAVNVQGMQTRSILMRELQQRLGPRTGMQQAMNQGMTDARLEMDKIKDRIGRLGSNGQDLEMPGFQPNDQRSKSFLKRLELGTNIQSSKSDYFFPTSTNIGLSLGYKLNSKSVAGIGISYRVGWGKDFRHISITHQGMGLRSFMDVKLKGSLWITGGGELNYRTGFRNFEVLRDFSPWQKSALIGVSKKYKFKKMNGNIQVLYDFLHKQQVPVAQSFVFRYGYNF